MNVRMFCLLALCITAICGCASVPDTQQPAIEDVAVAIEYELPAGWTELKRHHYPNAELGTRLRLRLDDWPWVRLDLFAYAVGVTDNIADGLAAITRNYRAEMDYAVEQGNYASWALERESAHRVATHQLLADGNKLVLRIDRQDEQLGSMTYLYYRPPFALKVRASYPGYADERTEAAIDAAVSELIPAIRVTAAEFCSGKKLNTVINQDLGEMSEEQSQVYLRRLFAESLLRHALDGCADLTVVLPLVDDVCLKQDALCGQPPWSMAED